MLFTPGWCVGWFFVPIMNIFKPYQAIAELWKASHSGSVEEWQEMETPLYIKIWWGAWLVSLGLQIEASGPMEKNWAIFFTYGFLSQETAH